MNLLLLEEGEVSDGKVVLAGRRARHILTVLHKGVGDSIRAGFVNRGTCMAQILSVEDQSVVVRPGAVIAGPAPRVHLILAVPRPKVVSRVVAAAASFGLRSLTFVNAWRVEKSYFASPRLTPSRLREDAWLGCEQGAQVWLPELRVAKRFVPFVENEVRESYRTDCSKIVLHPTAPSTLSDCLPDFSDQNTEVVLAIGPEGGWIESELSTLDGAGFKPAGLATGPLKTEVALAAAFGQLALLGVAGAAAPISGEEDWQHRTNG